MLAIEEGELIKCAECGKESGILYSGTDDEGRISLFLSCECRNAWCMRCDAPARDVSDTAREVAPFCDRCVTEEMLAYEEAEEAFAFQQPSKYISPKWRQMHRAYSLDDKRKENPRAYLKWTEDEKLSISFHAQTKTHEELVAIFQRQPHIVPHPRYCQPPEPPIPEQSAVRLLGANIVCDSCGHKSAFTFKQLEGIAEKLSIRVLMVTQDDLLWAMQSRFRCRCGAKDSNLVR